MYTYRDIQRNISLIFFATVLTVISADTAVKQVNEHEMVITYKPHILLIWQDPRLKFFNITERQIMPDEMADKIWIPKIAVEEQVITIDNNDGDIG